MDGRYKQAYSFKWQWHSDMDDVTGLNNGSVYFEPIRGQAYCLMKAPKYMKKEDWEKLAKYIVDEHNRKLDYQNKLSDYLKPELDEHGNIKVY